MADQDRDRYGDKLKEVERAREDDYFARRDRELIKKMREGGAAAPCPKCGGAMAEAEGKQVCLQCAKA